jgi:CRAL/TRIO domain
VRRRRIVMQHLTQLLPYGVFLYGQKAVHRFVKYWDKRIALFGERAFADISLDTLKKCSGETRPLELGVITILSRPKSPHRVVDDERDLIYVDAGKLAPTKYSRNEALRCFWALIHTLLMNDEQVQKRGAIYLINVAQFGRNNRDPKLATMCAGTAMGCLPVRLSAVHMCHTTPCHWLFFQCILWFAGERMRQRVLTHAAATCRAATLKSVSAILERDFGIARACLPIDLGGDVIVPALNQHKHC